VTWHAPFIKEEENGRGTKVLRSGRKEQGGGFLHVARGSPAVAGVPHGGSGRGCMLRGGYLASCVLPGALRVIGERAKNGAGGAIKTGERRGTETGGVKRKARQAGGAISSMIGHTSLFPHRAGARQRDAQLVSLPAGRVDRLGGEGPATSLFRRAFPFRGGTPEPREGVPPPSTAGGCRPNVPWPGRFQKGSRVAVLVMLAPLVVHLRRAGGVETSRRARQCWAESGVAGTWCIGSWLVRSVWR